MKSFEAKAFAKQLNLEDCLWEVARTGFQRHLLFGVKPLSLSPLSKLNCFPAKVHGISFIVCRYCINENVSGQLPHKSLLHLSAAEEMGTSIILKKSISDFIFPSQDQCWIQSFLHRCVDVDDNDGDAGSGKLDYAKNVLLPDRVYACIIATR